MTARGFKTFGKNSKIRKISTEGDTNNIFQVMKNEN